MTYRKESPQPTYKWSCAINTANDFRRFVMDAYGLQCGPHVAHLSHVAGNPHAVVRLQVGAFTADARADGDVKVGSQLIWRRSDKTLMNMTALVSVNGLEMVTAPPARDSRGATPADVGPTEPYDPGAAGPHS